MDGYNKFSIRTDLAIESHEMLHTEEEGAALEGIKVTVGEENIGIRLTSIEILNEEGAEKMGRPIGTYITIESEAMRDNDTIAHEEIAEILARELGKLHCLGNDDVILVAGLGNWNVTPDALGPKVVEKILVTRHIAPAMPQELKGKARPVSAISPGVMGMTGIETLEILSGIVEHIRPSLVIAIDALAARQANRINTTIQMSNTGIHPGAGVGNKRKALNQVTLGVPVIAIGVPTVVDAATLVNDTLDRMLDSMIQETEIGSEFYSMLQNLAEEEKYILIKKILDPYTGNMFVATKEVDAVIERLSKIIANALNIALHPGIHLSDMNRYIEA